MSVTPKRIMVTGAGGFIGHHLTRRLIELGHTVVGVDIKRPEFSSSPATEFLLHDLRAWRRDLCRGIQEVYHLAADMGGIGWITHEHSAACFHNTQIDLNVLNAVRDEPGCKVLFSSTACVYPLYKQSEPTFEGLKEVDAWPADPEPGYGLQKLYTEKLCEYLRKDYGTDAKVVRFHNVFGAEGAWRGGREKSIAALCRKVAEAKDGDAIEIWGDGQQTRSFLHIDECVDGLMRLMDSPYSGPVNLGSDECVTISDLVTMICEIAGKELTRRYLLDKPQGVRGRNSDNTMARIVFDGWSPTATLRAGLERTYPWIAEQVRLAILEAQPHDAV